MLRRSAHAPAASAARSGDLCWNIASLLRDGLHRKRRQQHNNRNGDERDAERHHMFNST
jgi:hypothetical protein